MNRLSFVVAAFAAFTGCATESTTSEDGRDDSFTTEGKLDGFQCTPAEAAAILHVVNTASLADLKTEIGLSAKAADNVVAVRLGDDEAAGTADDETFGSLAELDAVPYIGPTAFQKLLDYVHDADLVGDVGVREWHSTTILNALASDMALAPDGRPVFAYRTQTSAHLRLADGTAVDLPADALTGGTQVAVDAQGVPHIFYRVGPSNSTAVHNHASYRNGQWTQHAPIPGNYLRVSQSPNGTIFALAARSSPDFQNSTVTPSLITVAANGMTTAEPLWGVEFSGYKLDFKVGIDGYPALAFHKNGGWHHARRGPNGWLTVDLASNTPQSLVATTGGADATVFLDQLKLATWRQQGSQFTASGSIANGTGTFLDATVDGNGTAHACLVESDNVWHYQLDAAGTLTRAVLGNAGHCAIATDKGGVVHLMTQLGNVINHATFE